MVHTFLAPRLTLTLPMLMIGPFGGLALLPTVTAQYTTFEPFLSTRLQQVRLVQPR